MNIDRSTYSYYELSKTRPDIETIIMLAKLYDITVDSLLGYQRAPSVKFQDAEVNYNRNTQDPDALSALSKEEQQLVLFFRQLDVEKKQQALGDLKSLFHQGLTEKTKNLPD